MKPSLKHYLKKEISGGELNCILHNEDLYEERHFLPTHIHWSMLVFKGQLGVLALLPKLMFKI